MFEPYLKCPPPHPQVVRYGAGGDGSKLLCPLAHLNQSHSCVVVSVGSNGDYQFEAAILRATRCQVHTYDCTYNGTSIHPGRHTYHKVCIGQGGDRFKTWKDVATDWGHQHVAVAKVDIEGHETSLLSELQPGMPLPTQVVVEVHVVARTALANWPVGTPLTHNQAEAAVLFMHMASLGYALVAKELNPVGDCCAEYTFLLVENTMSLSGA